MDAALHRRARVHAALGEPARLAIVDELVLSDRTPAELGHRLSVRSNLLAHHLDVLESAGLVDRHVSVGDRRRRYVRLCHDALHDLATTTVRLPPVDGVLFVCTRNSARSQLATALWRSCSDVPASSAGTDPADRIHPGARRAARRHSLELDGLSPRRLDPDVAEGRLLVTVCDVAHEDLRELERASEASGLPTLHWSVPDPAPTGTPASFDAATEELRRRIDRLVPSVTTHQRKPGGTPP